MRIILFCLFSTLLLCQDFKEDNYYIKSNSIEPLDIDGFAIKDINNYINPALYSKTIEFFEYYKNDNRKYLSYMSPSWEGYIKSSLDENNSYLKNYRIIRVLDIISNQLDNNVVLIRIIGNNFSFLGEVYYKQSSNNWVIDDLNFNFQKNKK